MNWYHERNWRPLSGAAVIGLLVFGLSLKVAPADSGGKRLTPKDSASVVKTAGGANTPRLTLERRLRNAPLQPHAAERQLLKDGDRVEARIHFARVISSTPVSSAAGAAAARAGGTLVIG
ncbi:MAG: hypothetical protein IH897_07270, partial [Planctomycetes bacterium]|nr:hypothetical protein [Planctomycetota bacterium]